MCTHTHYILNNKLKEKRENERKIQPNDNLEKKEEEKKEQKAENITRRKRTKQKNNNKKIITNIDVDVCKKPCTAQCTRTNTHTKKKPIQRHTCIEFYSVRLRT